MYPLKVSRKLVVFLAASLALMIGTGTTFSLLKVKANVITNQFTKYERIDIFGIPVSYVFSFIIIFREKRIRR